MALRWDLKPAFPNAREGSPLEFWTIRSVISISTAFVGWIAVTWSMDYWTTVLIGFVLVIAFDAGDTRQPFEDEPENESHESWK